MPTSCHDDKCRCRSHHAEKNDHRDHEGHDAQRRPSVPASKVGIVGPCCIVRLVGRSCVYTRGDGTPVERVGGLVEASGRKPFRHGFTSRARVGLGRWGPRHFGKRQPLLPPDVADDRCDFSRRERVLEGRHLPSARVDHVGEVLVRPPGRLVPSGPQTGRRTTRKTASVTRHAIPFVDYTSCCSDRRRVSRRERSDGFFDLASCALCRADPTVGEHPDHSRRDEREECQEKRQPPRGELLSPLSSLS